MKVTNILTAMTVLTLSTLSASAYTTVNCNSDPVFAANSCNQCFLDKARSEGSHLGELKDEWINSSTSDKFLYKEEQVMPKMKNLAPSLVTWKAEPTNVDFWEYTPEFNKLYDNENEGYVLAKGKKVTWLKSKKGYTYTLSKNKAAEGKNIGLLKYTVISHNILDNGTINVRSSEHNECVLFKSGKEVKQEVKIPGKKPNTPKTPAKKLPKTGPEHYVLLMLLAMVLGFAIMKVRRRA